MNNLRVSMLVNVSSLKAFHFNYIDWRKYVGLAGKETINEWMQIL